MKLTRTLSTVVATILTGAVLASCSTTGAANDAGASAGAATNEATIAVNQELNTIDPPYAIDSSSANVINNIDEGLYRLDAKNQPAPAGAAGLPTVSADGLTYTIALNPDAKWSDGSTVTAGDYEFAWKRAIGLENASENQTYYGVLQNADEIIAGTKKPEELGVTATDDHTLQVTLTSPVSYFPSLLASQAFFPVPQAYVTEQGDAYGSDSEHALYNGPFTLADFAGPGVGTDWTFVKNDTYWDADAVKLDKIHVRVIKETNTAINLYKSGEIDQVAISGAEVQAEQSNPGFVNDVTATSAFLGYNQVAGSPFANAKVRQAISLVIDRDALTKSVLADGSTPATGLVPPGLAADSTGRDFADAAGDQLTTDVAQAKTLWEQAKTELGISTLDIDLETFDSDRVKSVAEYLQGVIQDNLDGTKVTVTTNPVANFLDKVTTGDFGVYLVTWGADFGDPSSQLGLFRSDAGTNWGKYSNPAYDADLEAAQGAHATDGDARFDDLVNAQTTLIADQGITPIFFQSSTLLRNPALQGVLYHTSGPASELKSAHFAR